MLFTGADSTGPITVKVYGRDAWDAQLLANVWRLAWYRGTQRTARLSRLELVEHEGFVTLLAERAGVPRAPPGHRRQRRARRRPRRRPARRHASPRCTTAPDRRRRRRRPVGRARPPPRGRHHPSATRSRPPGRHAPTARWGSPTCPRRRRPSRSPTPRNDEAQAARRCRSCSSARSGRRPSPATPSATSASFLSCRTCRKRPCRRRCATPSATSDIELDDVRNRLRALLGAEEQPLIKLRRVTRRLGPQPGAAGDRRLHPHRRLRRHRRRRVRRRAARRPVVVAGVRPPPRPAAPDPSGDQHDGLDQPPAAVRPAVRRCSSPSATSTWRSRARRRGWPSTCASSNGSACARRDGDDGGRHRLRLRVRRPDLASSCCCSSDVRRRLPAARSTPTTSVAWRRSC